MVHAARASTAGAPAPLTTRHFLFGLAVIKNSCNSPENNALNFSNRLKNACSRAHSAPQKSPITTQKSAIASSHLPFPPFLIATQILDIELTPSQQTRKHFLIATFSVIFAPAPHPANQHSRRTAPFLFDTNKTHRIIIRMRALLKTKEKQFSIRYKFAFRGTGLPAVEGNPVCLPQAGLCSLVLNCCVPKLVNAAEGAQAGLPVPL
jgi:hypothetical protein